MLVGGISLHCLELSADYCSTVEWTSQFIKIWFFPRSSTPSNLKSGKPDTSSWGTPQSFFKGNCDIDSHFKGHNIVFDTTFCGDVSDSRQASSQEMLLI